MITSVFSIPLPGQALGHEPPGQRTARRSGSLRRYFAGDENRLAAVAAGALLSEAATTYSPLVLHGRSGTGKSHLAVGLARAWKQRRPDASVICTTGADIGRWAVEIPPIDSPDEMVEPVTAAPAHRTARAQPTAPAPATAPRSTTAPTAGSQPGARCDQAGQAGLGKPPAARQTAAAEFRLPSADYLVIDDLHHLAGKPEAQHALVRWIDDVLRRDGRVVVTALTNPCRDPRIVPRLRSRLAAGLVVSLMRPSHATRLAVLAELAASRTIGIDAACLARLAEAVRGTVPELLGALVQLDTTARAEAAQISLARVEQYLGTRSRPPAARVKRIVAAVASHFGVKIAELKGPSRRRAVVSARDSAMYLARKLVGLSYEQLGRDFGDRDHTTVLHSCRKIERQVSSDPGLAQLLSDLEQSLADA